MKKFLTAVFILPVFFNLVTAQNLVDTVWLTIKEKPIPVIVMTHVVAVKMLDGSEFVNNGSILFIDNITFNSSTKINLITFKDIATEEEVAESRRRINEAYPVEKQIKVIQKYLPSAIVDDRIFEGVDVSDLPDLPPTKDVCSYLVANGRLTIEYKELSTEPLNFLQKYSLEKIAAPPRLGGIEIGMPFNTAVYEIRNNADPLTVSKLILDQETSIISAVYINFHLSACDPEPTPPGHPQSCVGEGLIWTNNDSRYINNWRINDWTDQHRPFDYDGDGVEEFLSFSSTGKAMIQSYRNGAWTKIWDNSGSAYLIGKQRMYDDPNRIVFKVMDSNGDKKDELFTYDGFAWYVQQFENGAWTVKATDVIDGIFFPIITGKMGTLNMADYKSWQPFWSSNKDYILGIGKSNNKVAIVSFVNFNPVVSYYDGTGMAGSLDFKLYGHATIIDADGDGRDEFMARRNNELHIEEWSPGNWTTELHANRSYWDFTNTVNINGSYYIIPGDYDGDGKEELLMYDICLNTTCQYSYMLKFNAWKAGDFVNVWNNGEDSEQMEDDILVYTRVFPVDFCGDGKKTLCHAVPNISYSNNYCILSYEGECYISVTNTTTIVNGFASFFSTRDNMIFRKCKICPAEVNPEDGGYIIKFYPNPIPIYFTIDIGLQAEADLEVRVIDLMGKEVALPLPKTRLNAGISTIDYRMPEYLPAGMYFLKIQVDDKTELRKVIYSKYSY